MRIESIQAHRMLLPLHEPYHLSYGTIEALDSVWVCVRLDNGAIGCGESTPLPGYSPSTTDTVWATTNDMARTSIGKKVSEVLGAPLPGSDGFLFAALRTALEEAAGLIPNIAGTVPLVGLTQERQGETPAAALRRVRGAGYWVFKIKVGFSPLQQDIERLTAFQADLHDGERIRVDANQALSDQQARILLKYCLPEKIELLEQPLPACAWTDCARIAQQSPIPIMLDESITDVKSLEAAAHTGAGKIVKLKLMKQGSITQLREMVAHAKKLGLEVVLGNGVAGWIDNRHEGIFWLKYLRDMGRAGEMNGYLKIQQRPSEVEFANGCLSLTAMAPRSFDRRHYVATASTTYGPRAAREEEIPLALAV